MQLTSGWTKGKVNSPVTLKAIIQVVKKTKEPLQRIKEVTRLQSKRNFWSLAGVKSSSPDESSDSFTTTLTD